MGEGRGARRSGRRARVLMDALRTAHDAEHAAQVRQTELLVALCAAFASVDAAGPVLPGRERLVASGGDGTPLVAEHLAIEVAPLLKVTLTTAGILIAGATDLVHRHPRVWAATQAGRLRVWQARQLADATHIAGLSAEAAALVDTLIEPALGRLPWGRLKRKLAGLIARADTALATRRAAQARAERFVRVTQHGDGTAFVVARTDAADAHRLWHTLNQVAGQLTLAGSTDPVDVLRATALGVLADPDGARTLLDGPDQPGPGDPHDTADSRPGTPGRGRRRPRPGAELVIHLAPGSRLGRCEELGPALDHQIAEWLGHRHVTVRPVIDLADDPAVDSYEVPAAVARIVRWRNPYEVFPWSGRASRGLDLDHTRPYLHGPEGPAGQTAPDNLGPLTRRVHRAKTHSGFQVTQPRPGVFHWTTPLGYHYRVDPHGSHDQPSPPPAPHSTRRRPGRPVPTPGVDGRSPRLASPITVDLGWPTGN